MSAEVELTHEIIRALNAIPGVWCWRRNVGRRGHVQFGKKGQSDIEGITKPNGRRLELEVKIDARVTPEQTLWIERMKSYGAIAGVVHSVDEAIAVVTGRSSF